MIFLALGAGSGLLASSMGCRMRLRALMNLPRGEGGDLVNHHAGGGGAARMRVRVHAEREGYAASRFSAADPLCRTDWDLTWGVKAQLSEGYWALWSSWNH